MENNEKKRFGRRAGFGIVGLSLITGMAIPVVIIFFASDFDVEVIKLALQLYGDFSFKVVAIIGFIFGGLTVTDVWGKKK